MATVQNLVVELLGNGDNEFSIRKFLGYVLWLVSSLCVLIG